ncbi:hypothetical protein Taro_016427 [Colocasia esculenta]|uniref:Putative plant transposon protein domain-containing protein n=1 Tax=Colocasia esculenta TaxID=4460 RepID=A0A843USY2_COLES|nr:hypothetical protein [Colocasia esculenta]
MAAPMITGSVGGYSAEFLSPREQERFAFVKTKIYGNKAVDVQNLEKSGMTSLVEALRRLQWMDVATFTEVSYPDLVKAFYIFLKSEADGSLVSSVRGIQIKINLELLHELFGVKTSGYSGILSVNDEVKGLGIIGPGFKLKDGKLDINQISAFNRLLHFIVCQIIVPRSATFSSCTRADSDIMFWAIQNKEIYLAAVMIERMKFAHAQIWETKSKLNVSLPYAHLLTQIFKHFGVDVSGAVVEKMGQSIRSRNLKKSGFSVQDGVWTKTSVAEGEAIIGDSPEVQMEEGAAEGHLEKVLLEYAPAQGEQESVELPAPIQGEQVGTKEPFIENVPESAAPSQEIPPPASVPVSEGPSASNINLEEPVTQQGKQKRIVFRRPRKGHRKVNLKPFMALLKAQGEILSSVHTSIQGITSCCCSATRANRAICSRVSVSRAICSRVSTSRAISFGFSRTSVSFRVFRTLLSSQRRGASSVSFSRHGSMYTGGVDGTSVSLFEVVIPLTYPLVYDVQVIVVDNFFTGSKDNLREWIGHPRFELIRHGITLL